MNILGLAGPESKWQVLDVDPAGFWAGLWHGLILPIAFLVSLFAPGVGIYERSNRGKLYDLGFTLGVGLDITLFPGFWVYP